VTFAENKKKTHFFKKPRQNTRQCSENGEMRDLLQEKMQMMTVKRIKLRWSLHFEVFLLDRNCTFAAAFG
jgi:hypothetical protein